MALWSKQWGTGPAVLFVHGSLGDSRLWEPVAKIVSKQYRSIVYDRRFFGRSTEAAEIWSSVGDAISVLDAIGVERVAIVGLSGGGGTAIEFALSHPERTWGIVHVAGAVPGIAFELDFPQGVDDPMERDFAVWAPLGVDDNLKQMWLATPKATGRDEGHDPVPAADARNRLSEIAAPTLFIVARHDPVSFKQVARSASQQIRGSHLIEVESDHYLTVRAPEEVAALMLTFLDEVAPVSAGPQ
jgi:3-oxoadipate enol-lactonase